ncbi:MAG: hypothetical protein HY875_05560 [Chloroflexi bacterium]|nr:hypothetical protein [Chloroflexota bacterium]
MTARQPRRTRRRAAPPTALPRPSASLDSPAAASRVSRRSLGHREHHVTTDYRYVINDLMTVAVVGGVAVAFIVGMSFFL